jgi:hypothetical protein
MHTEFGMEICNKVKSEGHITYKIPYNVIYKFKKVITNETLIISIKYLFY